MLESFQELLGEVESAWADEIERRIEAFDRGELPPYPAEEVFAEARTPELRAELARLLNAYEADGDPGRPAPEVIAEICRTL